jgi:hypothetical protein
VYGFETVDALEEAWLDYLRKPMSQVKNPEKEKLPITSPQTDKPEVIPPAKLPGASPPAGGR